jgi:7-cyano-7-deazaguanine synthase
MRTAVVLLSGGLDSATCLAIARHEGFAPHALIIDYGQRHRHELVAAAALASEARVPSTLVKLDLRAIGGSALTADVAVPKHERVEEIGEGGGADARDGAPLTTHQRATHSPVTHLPVTYVPVTYVPARNLTFLSIAVGLCEALGASDIFLGVNAVDYSGYPDCRPAFVQSFAKTAELATKAGIEGSPFRIHTPLIALSKAQIIQRGLSLGVDYARTHSCYDPVAAREPGGAMLACGHCDSCLLRAKGFVDAGVTDPTKYVL